MRAVSTIALCAIGLGLVAAVSDMASDGAAFRESNARRVHEMTIGLVSMGMPAVQARCVAESASVADIGPCIQDAYDNRPIEKKPDF